ncbi:mucin-5AC [Lucilia sericata]|uniref:mucin-5AC n=1 Tax=Lucilia sericata TaxID=13632 RepID=UPI0018A83016|nr:mucin-5AC [Lucilia sericata]
MLQPREARLLWRRRKRRHGLDGLFDSKICYYTLIIIGCLTLLPQGLTQHNDEIYIVKPTPALRLDKEELTTVLLVNNENHGRFINVRPEVGLLTSTARTFIQEGVTTEYATQVVGTTLDNGRVYAQYLKKSSRVLYDSGVPVPSVITSWVGESSLHSDSPAFLPQSHNDLFNADQPDWQAIDDRLIVDRRHHDDFVGNTDYVGLRRKPLLATSSHGVDEIISVGTVSKPVYNFVTQLGVLEENARKVAANKVLPIGDLPTYTIKQNYEPSAYLSSNHDDILEEEDSDDSFGRNPKLIYKKLMQNTGRSESEKESPAKPFIPVTRHLATVTYYGFADFTTVVGDSVIVFSPSTSTNNVNYKAQITSIKGEATLAVGLPQGPNISKVPITIAQDLIEPTITQQPSIETTLETGSIKMQMESSHEESTSTLTTSRLTEHSSSKSTLMDLEPITLLPSSEVVITSMTSKMSSMEPHSIEAPVMLSRPSDEEILRIYNALANANKDTDKIKIEPTTAINTTIATTAEASKDVPHLETSNVQIFGGATTIFFEDDPFANFVEPVKTSSSLESSISAQNTSSSNVISDSSISTTVSLAIEESLSTLDKTIEVNTQDVEIVETTTTDQPPLMSSEIILDTLISNSETPFKPNTKQSSQDTIQSSNILSNVLIKEIDPNMEEVPVDCISTSQVFLTQLPKTVTNFETVVTTINESELKTEILQKIQPTFEIKEATKYYCIQASKIQSTTVDQIGLSSAVNTEGEEKEDEQKQLAIAEVTEMFDAEGKTEAAVVINTTEEILLDVKTERPEENKDQDITENKNQDITEHSGSSDDEKEEEEEEPEDEEASGLSEEDDEDDEEIELIYKTLYTTYTYLTTFFHDDSTSISSHTEVVTNVMTSTLGISSTKESLATNLVANLNDNEINPTIIGLEMETTKRFVVPSEVESLIRTDEHMQSENEANLESSKSSESLATFYTTYTYYTTIFAEGETDIMSHTEVITNIKKSSTSASVEAEQIMPTLIAYQSMQQSKDETIEAENSITYKSFSENENTAMSSSATSAANDVSNLPNIPDLGDLTAITLVTDVRSSSSPGEKQIINNLEASQKIYNDKPSVLEDQISSESNTDTDEIIPSATLLLQTSFTTFTYYTTMYSGDKTNVISRLETMTNTVTETLQPSKTIDLEGASVPITYFTTFTYWTKLAREGQITTLSREETISNIIIPTMVQSQMESVDVAAEKASDTAEMTESSVPNETTMQVPSDKNEYILVQSAEAEIANNLTSNQYTTNLLEPTTYYTTYTYYTTSYEVDKTITDSRFETVTNIITPTVTLSNSGEWESTLPTPPPPNTETRIEDKSSTTDVILYDFKKIIDADGISTIFFTTEIKPSINSDGITTEIISSTSSLLIDEEKRRIQATESSESSTASLGVDGLTQKQYKTGLVRLIEGTRISNRTTTLYQSKVIGTVIDQRYAQIIESTSSFIFENTKSPSEVEINPTSTTSGNQNIPATQQVELTSSSLMPYVEGSIIDTTAEQEIETTTKPETEIENADEENYSKTDEKLRFPFQTKKPAFISPLKPFSNRNRPQFAPKKNSSATIITRSDFTPTITATPALKTINRFSSSRRGSANGGIASSNSVSLASSTRRFKRPNKQSSIAAGLPNASTLGSTASRNRYASSSSARGSFSGSSSRRVGNSASTIRPSFSRPSLFSTGFPNNSRLRVKPTATTDLGEISSIADASTTNPLNSQEEGDSLDQNDSSDDDEENTTTESNRRQNNPLLRLRRPLNRPQGFTPARTQQNSNSPSNSGVTLRRNPLIARSRSNSNSASLTTTTTTTTTNKPKTRSYQPLLTQNRLRPTNSLFPPRNIFGVQKQAVTTEENRDLSEEDTNENNENDDSEYEDDEDDEEDSENDDEDEVKRRRRSHYKTDAKEKQKNRKKREADSNQQNRSNFRQRFRRPKLATHQTVQQAETKSNEDEVSEAKEVPATTQRTRTRFGGRYSGHSSTASSTTSATTSAATSSTSSNHKVAIRPTRPTGNNGRAQFTLREKDSSQTSTTQKVITSAKRPAFRRPQPGSGSVSTRRLPSSTSPSASSSSSGKRRLKSFNNQDSTTTSRNSVTGRNRSSSSTSGRSRPSSGSSRDNISGRNRPRNNHNYNSNNNNNNNNEALVIDNSGTITVTHVIPAEVTIPVVNGKITEYKQVVTAKTSTEVLGPQQYTTTIGNNGLTQLALTREDSSVNYNGATEITQYILHETPTTTITFTPTTIRGRKTSFSHVLPSTVYSVEQVVSTQQPQISANAPLANILLSQLLLGNVGLPAANPLLGALGGALSQPGVVGPPQPATPVTEYKTHASTYVTTVFEGQSTVLPITFQGKKILTTIFDTTAQTITATEFITDTIVTTPTVAQQQPVVNSLLLQQLLLQQHLQQQQIQQPTPDPTYPLNAILNSVPPQFLLSGDNLQELEASNNIRGSGHGDILLNEDDDFSVGSSSVDIDDIALQAQAQTHKTGRKKTRKSSKNHKRKQNNNADSHPPNESSVITLYVSGRRPGEFSTVLSTVQIRPDSTLYKRHAHTIDSGTDYLNEGSELVNEYWALPPKIILLDGKDKNENELTYESKADETATQSLESIVGDVSLWYNTQISAAATNTAKLSVSSTEKIDQKSSPDSYIQDILVNSSKQHFFA